MNAHSGCWSITLDEPVDAPRIARRVVGEWLADVPRHVRDDALLAVNELVSNAVRFGRPPICIAATADPDAVVIEVSDEGEGRPRRRVPTENGGLGLNLVYFLADSVEIDAARPHVRCAFATRKPQPASASPVSDLT
jgi:anti-sigma regulatory factor (Ser/Thr protein kinase)